MVLICYIAIMIVTMVGIIFSFAFCTKEPVICSFTSAMCGIIFVTFLVLGRDYNTPAAIDVYRDKTTLKITYVDSIPTDSVVIYKSK